MASVSDCRTATSGARLGCGQHGQRGAEEQREDGDLENLILRDGLGDVFRKDIEQQSAASFRGLRGRGARRIRVEGGKRDARSRPARG